MSEISNDIVYHYCTPDTFLNIIQNASIWLSDGLKSNDSMEECWIRNQIAKEIKSKLFLQSSGAVDLWEEWTKAFYKPPMNIYIFLVSLKRKTV